LEKTTDSIYYKLIEIPNRSRIAVRWAALNIRTTFLDEKRI
uniref:Transposase n=1 Tax=Haemonchus placei TaxID=6290 RepID=A0A0N4WXP4_HAEPC